MKNTLLIIFILFSAKSCLAQSIDIDLIKYNGLSFYSSKSEIIEKLGQPEKTYDPNYDCGFLSTYSQDIEFLTLDYGIVKFTGNEKDLYVLEQVNFDNNRSVKIEYGNYILTYETNLNMLIEIFGQELEKQFENSENGYVVIINDNADDGIRIEIKDGKLIQFGYWSPC